MKWTKWMKWSNGQWIFLTLAALLSATLLAACDGGSDDRQTRTDEEVRQQVVPATSRPAQDGIALAVVVDCSGSMADSVSDGRKTDLAKNCVRKIVQDAEAFAKSKNTPVKVALYKFADAPEKVWPTTAPAATPDAAASETAIQSMNPSGGTAIGEAVIAATRDLNQSGYSNVNVLVVTDGENTQGTNPDAVSSAFSRLPEPYRPKVFVVAFDVNAAVFSTVKTNGWKVLSASNGAELSSTLDTLVGGEILLEK